MLFHRVSAHVLHIKPGKDGLEFQPFHVLVSLRRIQILNLCFFIFKRDRTGNTDFSQFLAHNRQIVMLFQRFFRSWRLHLVQMRISILDASVCHDQVCGCLFSNGRNARNIVRSITHQRLDINELSRRYLVLPFHILRIVIMDLRRSAAGLRDPDLDVGI